MPAEFSFIILTFNEEQHLPRLLNSISGLHAACFVLDSGSTDGTLEICKRHHVSVAFNKFENHPRQWNVALNVFTIETPWVICLDADQIVTPELYLQLETFRAEDYEDIDGIYFNRKNIFKGKWIRHGGYYPVYLLKMFRYTKGYSDLNENMDHKFQVPGKTLVWKKGHLIEENLKENEISFWIEKHNRYSDLVAAEEIERMHYLREQTIKPDFWGDPNARNAWLKKLWWSLPRYVRPLLYFSYRLIFQRGLLDGKQGIIFHFLQGFWFRLIVDIKIEEQLKEKAPAAPMSQPGAKQENSELLNFAALFPALFLILYYFNIAYIGLTSPEGYYIRFLDQHLNYIQYWREFNIMSAASILEYFGYEVYTNQYRLHVEGRSGFILVYSCLGYGILSLFTAFVLSFPKPLKQKVAFLIFGIVGFQLLNMTRLILLALYWKPSTMLLRMNSHDIFNCIIYFVVSCSFYFWLKLTDVKAKHNT